MAAALALAALVSITMLASCGDDEENSTCVFALEMDGNPSFSGSGNALEKGVAYLNEVNNAYKKALGMTSSEITLNGSLSDNASTMKAKFEAASLPDELDASECQYSFTIQLVGYNENKSSRTIVASRTFQNK